MCFLIIINVSFKLIKSAQRYSFFLNLQIVVWKSFLPVVSGIHLKGFSLNRIAVKPLTFISLHPFNRLDFTIMQKSKWNSRDDRSGKPGKPAKRTVGSSSKTSRPKSERSADANSSSRKRFGGDNAASFKPKYKPAGERPVSPGTGSRFKDGSGRVKSSGTPATPGASRPARKFGDTSGKPYPKKTTDGKNFAGKWQDRPYKPLSHDNDSRGRHIAKRNFEEKPLRRRATGKNSSKKQGALPADDGKIRLNRYISNAGICSRRKADELIQAGVISVNGEVVAELGFKVDPSKDAIRYNGELLKREKMVYVLLNKPKDYITTTDDPQERNTVMHLVAKASNERIYPVGRLDRNTTGLLLLTNDGDLTDKLSHPRNSVTKIYNVELNKSLSQGDLNKIAFGLELEDGPIKPDAISYVQGGTKREVGVQIHSGKNRIVRRIFEHLGYEVVKLDRVIYANLTKKDLPRGRWRYLEEKEVIQLKHLL
jgi:23S rRNA pseudouridine2605 synthase